MFQNSFGFATFCLCCFFSHYAVKLININYDFFFIPYTRVYTNSFGSLYSKRKHFMEKNAHWIFEKKKKKRTLSSLWHARRHQKKKPHHITYALCTFEPCTLNIYKLSWNPTPKLMRTPIPIILRIMADIKRTGQRISLPRQIRSRLDSIVRSQHKFIR